jgi:hypothetical protein
MDGFMGGELGVFGVFGVFALGALDGAELELEGCAVNEGVGVFEGAFDWEGEGASDVGAEEGVDVGFVENGRI